MYQNGRAVEVAALRWLWCVFARARWLRHEDPESRFKNHKRRVSYNGKRGFNAICADEKRRQTILNT